MPATLELLQEGRYRIEQPLSENGNGSIYQAFDTVRNSNVVVKEIVVRLNKVTTLSQQENMKSAFADQAKVLTSLRHDSLLQVEDFFSEVGRQYLVLENVEGDDFHKLLEQNNRPFSVQEVTAWADQLLDGLHYLHNFNPSFIHKNLKPRNIRLTVDGKVKLFAHGLSDGSDSKLTTKLSDDSSDAAELNYSPLELIWDGLDAASQKVIINSYDDRSERVLKEPADARSDIYSLGATLYFLLTAKVPVDPLERSIELLEGNQDPLKSPNKLDPRVPAEVSDVVMRAMEIKRESRFDSAVIMRQVLRTAVVRMQEKESVESLELEEAAEDLKYAEKVRHDQVQKLVEQKSREIEEEKRDQAELLEQKLREAEEQRSLAEKRAAEAERLLLERENAQVQANIVAASANHDIEDDLLGLNTSDSPNVQEKPAPAPVVVHAASRPEPIEQTPEPEVETYFEASKEPEVVETADEPAIIDPEPDEELAVEMEPEASHVDEESIIKFARSEEVESDPEVEDYLAEPSVFVEEASEPETISSVYDSDEVEYAVPARSGLPIPMIAGAAAVLLILAIGGWMFLGSSPSEPQIPVPTTASQQPPATEPETSLPAASEEPAVQNAFVPDSNSNTQVENTTAAVPEPTTATDKPAVKATPAKTPKPAADPAKTPAPKKAVTVDDLINDN
ncbi:MAG TPA: protein kinase [Pyrinomonadaceae bacterium]|nr:protein kinase [Pyrinomonadaceae bacterium]